MRVSEWEGLIANPDDLIVAIEDNRLRKRPVI